MTLPPWEDFVRAHFPGYVLPASARDALSVEEAARFLSRLSGRPHELSLLRATSTLSPRMEELRRFAFAMLPDLVRALPSQAEITSREWEGGFQGRLDVQATRALWAAGRRTRFATRTRRRSFALPENVLVRGVAGRLLEALVDLRQAGLVSAAGWGAAATDCEGQLRHLLSSTILREVPHERIGSPHEQAAHASRHPCHVAALDWHRTLQQGLDDRDPARIAAVVADGALRPLDEPTRFEVAVVIRLVQAVWGWIEANAGPGWTFHRCLVRPNRDEVASFEKGAEARVRIFYNQSHLGPGPCDGAARHYLDHKGRLRPDATLVVETGGHRNAAVVEVKHTARQQTMLEGLHEAMLYRFEYDRHLRGWPKAILVTSGTVPGQVRADHDVIAVGWHDWVPPSVTESLLAPLRR